MTTLPDGDAVIASPSPRARRPWRSMLGSLVLALAALFVASIVIFFALHYLPGDLAAVKAGVEATPEQVDIIRREMGLNRPVLAQYWDWFSGLCRSDFGQSSLSHRGVGAELVAKMAVTAPLALASLLAAVLIATPLGVLAAVGRHQWWGQCLTGLSQLGVAIPAFILGILLVDLFSVRAGLFPATGFPIDGWSRPVEAIESLTLPIVTLAVPQTAVLMRFVRSSTVEVLHHDHIRTARAQGLRWAQALGQSWRMVALPLTAVVALDFASLIMGAVLVEQVFALPGVGSFLLSSVSARDITVVQSTLMVMSSLIIVVMTLSTLAQQLLDPRLRS